MDSPAAVYLMVSGATTAYRARDIVPALLERYGRVITVPTPHAARVISPWDLARIPGNVVVSDYLDSLLRPRPPESPVLFAPCSFNSLNKLAHGLADNLALSITAEMIGRGQRVVAAVSVNSGLWGHPQTCASMDALRRWGVVVVEPRDDGSGLAMAPTGELLAALAGAG